MPKVLAFVVQKGGCGKTTSCKEVGIALSRLGKKILFIDLDPQSNLTHRFKAYRKHKHIAEVLKGEATLQESIIDVNKNISIVPGHATLGLLHFFQVPNKEDILRKRFKNTDLSKFDYVLIDTNADFGNYTFNALSVADSVYIPILVEAMALEGANVLQQGLKLAKEFVADFKVQGIFCTFRDSRRREHKTNEEEIREYFKELAMDTVVRRNAALDNANTNYKSIFDFDMSSHGAADYMNLTLEILEREENIKIPITEVREKLRNGGIN